MRVREVDDLLAAADKFERDPVPLVGRVQEVGRDPELRELAVEHHDPLLEGEVGPGREGLLAAEELDVLLRELGAGWLLLRLLSAQVVEPSGDQPAARLRLHLDHLGDRGVVQPGGQLGRVLHRAEAQQQQVADQVRVLAHRTAFRLWVLSFL